ncbi:hypothetical protein B4Q13_17785, partial [Lacticaseibacillus rhamnosus]
MGKAGERAVLGLRGEPEAPVEALGHPAEGVVGDLGGGPSAAPAAAALAVLRLNLRRQSEINSTFRSARQRPRNVEFAIAGLRVDVPTLPEHWGYRAKRSGTEADRPTVPGGRRV